MPSRRLFVAAAALLPLSADAGRRKRRRWKRRRCPVVPDAVRFGQNSCWRESCDQSAWRCGPADRDCLCAAAGAGVGLCVTRPEGDAPLCPHCVSGQLCVETCEHPGEQRCYWQCV
jgi:hypothetical protein